MIEPTIDYRINILRCALKSPEGIDAIMKLKPEEGPEFQSFLEQQAAKIDDLSECELWALTILIGIKRKSNDNYEEVQQRTC